MKFLLFFLTICFGVCLSFVFPTLEFIRTNCLRQDDPEIVRKYQVAEGNELLCQSKLNWFELHRLDDDIQDHKRNGTLPDLFKTYHSFVDKYGECQKSIYEVGFECLPMEKWKYIDGMKKAFSESVRYMFANNANNSIAFIQHGGYDCFNNRTFMSCFQYSTSQPYEVSSMCKHYNSMKICMEKLKQKCPNVNSFVPDLINISISALCISEVKSQEKREIRSTNILDGTKYAVLSLFSRRSRVAREIGGVGSKLHIIEQKLQMSCQEKEEEVKSSMKDMKICLRKKKLFVVTKQEYIQHIEECSKELRQLLKECLPEELKYLPDLIFKLVESMVGLLYDDFSEMEYGLGPCVPKLRDAASQHNYTNCIEKVEKANNDKIPDSKESFCEVFIPISQCFVKQMNETCEMNDYLKKLSEDYMKAVKRPCA